MNEIIQKLYEKRHLTESEVSKEKRMKVLNMIESILSKELGSESVNKDYVGWSATGYVLTVTVEGEEYILDLT